MKIIAEIFGITEKFGNLCIIIIYKHTNIMVLSKKKSELIKSYLIEGDIREIAGVLGYSKVYVRKILDGKRSYTNAAGREVTRLAIRKARLNKNFRTQKVA